MGSLRGLQHPWWGVVDIPAVGWGWAPMGGAVGGAGVASGPFWATYRYREGGFLDQTPRGAPAPRTRLEEPRRSGRTQTLGSSLLRGGAVGWVGGAAGQPGGSDPQTPPTLRARRGQKGPMGDPGDRRSLEGWRWGTLGGDLQDEEVQGTRGSGTQGHLRALAPHQEPGVDPLPLK